MKSSSDVPERGSVEAEVTVLFSRTKTTGSAWSKAQKSTIDRGQDSKKQDESDDMAPGQDLFGSLVASVGQKLTQQDDPPAQQSDAKAADASPDVSLNRVSQLMRHGVLPDSLQNVTQKIPQGAEEPGEFPNMVLRTSPRAVDSQPAPEADVASIKNFGDLAPPNEIISAKSLNAVQSSRNESVESQPVLAMDDAPPNPLAPTLEKATQLAGVDKSVPGNRKDALPQQIIAQVTSGPDVTPVTVLNGMDGKLLSPAAQIVENIKNAVAPVPVVSQASSAAPLAVKTLEIQLQPEGLGPVTVSLKSEQGKLKVQISAKLDTTRQELERSSAELVSGLRTVDPTFTDVDVNFSDQNQGATPDTRGQAFGNGGERRGTPENMPGFGSNGGQDANQASANRQNAAYGKLRTSPKVVTGELPSRRDRADGIYI